MGYSVVIFSVGAFFCMFVLFLRRKAGQVDHGLSQSCDETSASEVFGGELGGPRVCKHITSVILVMVWCVQLGFFRLVLLRR